jgi:lactoylglutathione lyase
MKGIFTYTGIRVKDLEKSVKFYTQVLGMKEIGRGTVEAAQGQVVSLVSDDGGPQLELNYYEKGSKFATDYTVGEGIDHLAFKVDDLDKALNEAKRLGYPTVLDMKGQSSRWAYIEDPNGIHIELFA